VKKTQKTEERVEKPESSVLSPKEVFLGAASAYLTSLACVVATYLAKHGNNSWMVSLGAVVDDLDFEARSGNLTEKQLFAVQKVAIHLEFQSGEANELPNVLFKGLEHCVRHMRDIAKAVEDDVFKFDMMDCLVGSCQDLQEKLDLSDFHKFSRDREEWFKKEVIYRKHPERRPQQPRGLDVIILGAFGVPAHHGRAKKDDNVIEV
jgi:hypothetical protein